MIFKKIFSTAICAAIALSAAAGITESVDAASFSEINQSSVFIKQQTSTTCTLASNVMLLRRTAMMRGDSDWSSITESACRSTLWLEGVGMYHNYTYKNISVSYQYISGSSKTALINALKAHPEGIVAYDYDYPHAILLTDYTDGVFYCADPARNTGSGRMNVSNSLIKIDNVDTYWYVTSPSVSLSGSSGNDDTTVTVSETWKITAESGVNMRSGAGTSYSRVGGVPYNATVTVTKKKTSGGYTWGYISYNSTNGWIALDYAKKVTVSSLQNTSVLSKTGVMLGDSVTIKCSAKNGTGSYQYALYARKSTESDLTLISDYSTNQTITFKPSQTGKYVLRYKVKDSSGTVSTITENITVGDKAVENTSVLSKTGVMLGDSVTIKCSAKNGTGSYQYALYARKSTESDLTLISDYSTNQTITFKPSQIGKYVLRYKVKDSSGTVSTITEKITVGDKAVENTSVLSKTGVMLGDSVTIKCSAKNGTGSYQYALYARKSTESDLTLISDYSTNQTITFKPLQTGKYVLRYKVKDSSGTVSTITEKITVGDKAVENTSVLSNTEIMLGDSVTIQCSAKNGTGSYQYALYARKSTESDLTLISDYSTNQTITFKPSQTGKYVLRYKVKDSSGTVSTITEKLNVSQLSETE